MWKVALNLMLVYDTAGLEVLGDTIVNRGCLIKKIDETEAGKNFYSEYPNFMRDMHCHLEIIGKILNEKPFAIKQRRYKEAK